MAKMTAAEAAVRVLENEGVPHASAFPVLPSIRFIRRCRARQHRSHAGAPRGGRIPHGGGLYPRQAGNIGVCIGTSGPAGTDMITGLYSAQADSIPILCITGQAPRARLYKEDFQAVDIESIAKPVCKWAVTVREAAQVPRIPARLSSDAFGQAGAGADRSALRCADGEIDFDLETYQPLPVYKPAATRAQIEKALALLNAAERPLIVAGGGIINANASEHLVNSRRSRGFPSFRP